MTWELNNQQATLKAKTFVAKFDLSQPYLGLNVGNQQAAEISQLFGFLVPDSPVETYVRGDDLSNRYPPRNSDLVSYQTYYRLAENKNGIQLLLSAQTSLLDSDPQTQVTSAFEDATLLYQPPSASVDSTCSVVEGDLEFDQENAPRFFLIRPNTSKDHSWALFVHPTDFYRASVRATGNPSVAFHVFPNSLEKGVIRRATFQLYHVEREGDVKQAAELLAEAEQASPPLTT